MQEVGLVQRKRATIQSNQQRIDKKSGLSCVVIGQQQELGVNEQLRQALKQIWELTGVMLFDY